MDLLPNFESLLISTVEKFGNKDAKNLSFFQAKRIMQDVYPIGSSTYDHTPAPIL